jgi:soluble lytic murein transglycosylase-like protein
VRPDFELGAWVMALLVVAAAASPAWADELLYYVDENGGVVFTNTASRGDAKPVPGLAQRVAVARGAPLPATPYDNFIDKLAARDGLDPDLIKAVAMVESSFDPKAISPKGAMGLMQLMPATAKHYGVDDPLDPYENLGAGSRHLRHLLNRFDGDLTLALAAYNAGAGAVQRYGGVPRYPETIDYVRKVHSKMDGGPVTRGRVPAEEGEIELEVSNDGSVVMKN